MYLDKSEIKDDSYTKAYLVNEYFDINKINLTNENIEKYLKFNVNYDPQRINRASYITFKPYGKFILGSMESPNATPVPPYNLFVKVTMSLYNNDILVKEVEKIFLSKYNTSLQFTCDDFNIDKDEFDKYQIKTSYEVLENSQLEEGVDKALIVQNKTGVIYKDILKNTDLAYLTGSSYLKENIVLKASDVPEKFVFTYEGKDIDYKTKKNGDIDIFLDGSKTKAYRLNAPFMNFCITHTIR
jgi:hypothetical protein